MSTAGRFLESRRASVTRPSRIRASLRLAHRRRRWLAAAACSLALSTLTAHDDKGEGTAEEPGYIPDRDGFPPSQFESQGITLLSWISGTEFAETPTAANDCWGYVAPSGREYALIGLSIGVGVVDISDPDSARLVEVVPGMTSRFRDIKTFATYAYAVTEGTHDEEGNGIQVIDLTHVDVNVVTEVATVDDDNNGRTHNIAVDSASGFLYRCGGGDGSAGIRVYDLSDPASPQRVGTWNNRYVHDAQVVTHTQGEYAGRELAYCCSNTGSGGGAAGLHILDVTDKDEITVLGATTYPGGRLSHQGWLSEDRRYFFLNDERDERDEEWTTTTHVIDVSDPTQPLEVGTFTNGSAATDHNLYVLGDRLFAANYKSGLRVFDIATPLAATEVRYFDTYPEETDPQLNGLWSCYPFFPSGVVIGSDINRGLFVWWADDPLLEFDYAGERPTLASSGDVFAVTITARTAIALDPESAELHIGTGDEFESFPLAARGDDRFDVTLGDYPCLATLEYYVSAETVNGIRWRDPPTEPAFLTVACGDDCDADGVPDAEEIAEGAPDCDADGVPDGCQLESGGADCDGNGVLDSCELENASADCDADGTLDSCQIASGESDCDADGILDSCQIANGEPDCDGDGVLDSCAIAAGAGDCDADGVPDTCEIESGEADCDANGTPDSCELSGDDCDGDGILDSCAIALGAGDCDGDGILDTCELSAGAEDCDGNDIPDSCELAERDADGDGILDACEVAFLRGDANTDAGVDISDAVFVLLYLFADTLDDPSCLAACDADESGTVNITDAFRILANLFGVPPDDQILRPGCVIDTSEPSLSCASYDSCADG